MTAAQIIGGVALIVFGIRFLRKGLSKLFGSKLESWLLSMTQNGWKALLAGTLVGTVAPPRPAYPYSLYKCCRMVASMPDEYWRSF